MGIVAFGMSDKVVEEIEFFGREANVFSADADMAGFRVDLDPAEAG